MIEFDENDIEYLTTAVIASYASKFMKSSTHELSIEDSTRETELKQKLQYNLQLDKEDYIELLACVKHSINSCIGCSGIMGCETNKILMSLHERLEKECK